MAKSPTAPAVRRVLVIGAIVVVALGGLYLAAVLLVGDGVRAGTTVAGIPIGGMSRDEAAATLDASIGKRVGRPIKVRAKEQVFVVDPKQSGITFDAQATLASASGRTWNPLALIGDLLGHPQLQPVVMVDDTALTAQVEGIATAIDHPATEPSLTMKGTAPKFKPGRDGHVLDQPALAAAIRSAVLEKRKPIEAPIISQPPSVSTDEALQAIALARSAVSGPVRVTAGATVTAIPASAIARALSFTVRDGALVPSLNGAILHAAIAKDLEAVETPGRDATFVIRKGVPVVVPSVVGSGIADEELAQQVVTVLDKAGTERSVSVSMGVRPPKITTEQAQALGITEKLSSFTQRFPYAAYRVQNIGKAAENVNGTLLLPGETFSMNEAMGERTVENGYTKGYVIGPGGVFTEDLGGGVSTATTAVWTAAFFAGMERVSTTAHSIYISRYKPGLEATVAWGIFDMKFKNTNPTAVFITTKMTRTSVTVTFWGTRVYDDVEAVFGPKTNIRPFATVYDSSKTCNGQDGVEGFTITVDRVFTKDGAEVKREPITTTYKPAPNVICGEKPIDPTLIDPLASPAPASSASPAIEGPPDPAASAAPSPSPTKKKGKPAGR